MKKKDLLDLFKSGNFTIITWDNGDYSVYKGRFKRENMKTDGDGEYINQPIFEDCGTYVNGYMPEIVALLCQALGGKTDSI